MVFNSEVLVWKCWLQKMKTTYTEGAKTGKVEACIRKVMLVQKVHVIWGCTTRNIGCKTYNPSTLFGTCVSIQNAAWQEFRGQ